MMMSEASEAGESPADKGVEETDECQLQNVTDIRRASRVLIVEQRHSGHLLVYVREIVLALQSLGQVAILAVGDSVPPTPEFAQNIADLDISVLTFKGSLTLRAVNHLIHDVNADSVIVPHGDELAVRIGLVLNAPRRPVVLLIMRDPRWEIRSEGLTRRIRLISKQLLLGVASFRPRTHVVWLRSFGYKGRVRHAIDPFIPDGSLQQIADAGNRMRQTLGMTSDVFWFVVTGSITDRKNVPRIAKALVAAQRRNSDLKLGLALIGPHRTSYALGAKELLGNSSELRFVTYDRVLSNFEMNAAVAASDAMIMAYSSHSPNSTMLKSLAIGKRIVVAGPRSVRSFAEDMGIDSIVPLTHDDLVGAIEAVAKSRPLARPKIVPSGHDFAAALIDTALGATDA